MKSLLFSCRNVNSKIKELATRPVEVEPEPVTQTEYAAEKAIAVFVTVEKGDDIKTCAKKLTEEVRKFCLDTGMKKVVLFPFAHLSSNIAPSMDSRACIDFIEKDLKSDLEILRVHFGSHKSLLLDVHGHKGNIRFREF